MPQDRLQSRVTAVVKDETHFAEGYIGRIVSVEMKPPSVLSRFSHVFLMLNVKIVDVLITFFHMPHG